MKIEYIMRKKKRKIKKKTRFINGKKKQKKVNEHKQKKLTQLKEKGMRQRLMESEKE